MDAHLVSFTTISGRDTSRIWKDLKTCQTHTILELDAEEEPDIIIKMGKRRAQITGRLPRIGIVGAGLAGLRCADVLLQHNFEVTLIEGRNRLGGRVHQIPLIAGHLVDAGPNWIHGTNDNPIMELAKKTNTSTGSWTEKLLIVDGTGKAISPSDAALYSGLMWDIIGTAFTHSNKNCADIDPNESLYDYFSRELTKTIPETLPDYREKREIVYQLAESWGAYVGNHVFSQSLKFFWLEECIDGENLFVSNTYEKILEAIAKPAIERAKVRYGAVVNKVRCCDDENRSSLKIHTEGGETMEFDEVVFTAPLGWLKQHPGAFDPPLPTRLAQAIENIGYGCLEKVYISFPVAFWKSTQTSDGVEGFVQYLSPGYASDTNPHRWHQELVDLASFGPSDSHPTLLFYMFGEQSKFLTEEVAKLPSKEKKAAFLYEWFRPYYSRLPHYDGGSRDCQPVACFATEWLNDDLAGNGSYSNFQTGLQEGDKDIETMREGVPDRGLWLAGEHTAPFVALGTVTGAYWSGESVGKRIVQAYGKGKGGVSVAG
ncbi:FAD/NAD(P)-binding domain-containing protein [Poronia punctata]|nr:FAD/NAD(P)-binding domain-containing protein [Poronia punctata]